MVTRADHVAVVDVVSVKADWDARHEQILSTIDLDRRRELEGRRRPRVAHHDRAAGRHRRRPDADRPRHDPVRRRRARRRVPGRHAPRAPASSGWRRESGSCAATPARAAWSCTRPTGGRDVHPHDARERTAPVFDLHARPLEDLRADVRTLVTRVEPDGGRGPRPRASPARRPAGRGEARHRAGRRRPWRRRWRPRGPPPPTSATRRAAARCSSGRRPACRSTAYPDDLLAMMTSRRSWAPSTAPPPPGAATATRAPTWTSWSALDRRDAARHQRRPQQRHLPSSELVQADREGDLRPDRRLRSGRARADVGVGEHVVRRSSATPTSRSTPSTSAGPIWSRTRPARQRAVVPRSPERVDPRDGPPHRARPHLLLPGTGPARQQRRPDPRLRDASADVLATTMFPSANPGDIDKRTLEPDDQTVGVRDLPRRPGSEDVLAAGNDAAGR